MNIGIVTTWFERGAAYVSRAYLDVLSEQHSVFIYARGGEKYAIGDPKWDLPCVTWGKTYSYRGGSINWKSFRQWIERNRLDVIIFNEQQNWDIIARIISSNLKIILGSYIDYYTPQTIPFYGLYDFLLCNTKRHYWAFRRHDGALYIPWGTDIELFHPGSGKKRADKQVTFFHSAGLNPFRKGTDLVIKAFDKLQGDAHLIVHAQSQSILELFRKNILHHAEDVDETVAEVGEILNRNKRIEIIGKEVSAPGLYHLGDVYVYPSRLEGIGLTVAEAMACGLPVIATDCPPMNEFVEEGINGKRVSVASYRCRQDNYFWPISLCDQNALIQAMQYYVDHHEQLPTFKSAARSYAERYIDWAANACTLNTEIERIAGRARPRKGKELLSAVREFESIKHGKITFKALKKDLAFRLKTMLDQAKSMDAA